MTIVTEVKTTATVIIKVNFLKDFLSFLDERKALLPWMENISEFGGGIRFETIREKKPTSWLKAAFVWHDTKEGVGYWNDLDEEWLHYLGGIEKEAWEKAKKEHGPNTILDEIAKFEGE